MFLFPRKGAEGFDESYVLLLCLSVSRFADELMEQWVRKSLSWRYLLKEIIDFHCPGGIYLRKSSIFILLEAFP